MHPLHPPAGSAPGVNKTALAHGSFSYVLLHVIIYVLKHKSNFMSNLPINDNIDALTKNICQKNGVSNIDSNFILPLRRVLNNKTHHYLTHNQQTQYNIIKHNQTTDLHSQF